MSATIFQDILQAKSERDVRKQLIHLQLPDGVSKNKLGAAIWNIKQKTATPEEQALVKLTLSKPIALKAAWPAQDATQPNVEPIEPATEPVQEPVEASEPGIETGVNEDVPEAPTVKGEEAPADGREELQKEERSLKRMIKLRKAELNLLRKNLPDKKGAEKIETEAKIAKLEGDIQKREEELPKVKEQRLSLAPGVTPDEEQPWFGRVYANCTGYAIKNSDGTFKVVNKDVASTYLRDLGISQERDTHTTSPLDRAILAIHDRHSVDMTIALAGYQPGVFTLPDGRKILITRGPKLLEPVPGEFPTIQKFLDGMLRDQAVYFHGWMRHAVKNLYAGEIKKGQSLVLAGPIDTGKSVCQTLIISPLLGGRVAKPYAFLAGRTDFNGDWFECEHLMLEDETPPRDYETQQLVAAGLKSLSANDDQWCHGKGLKALTLSPFWRVSVSVNNNPEAMRAIPVNDPTLKDKMNVLMTYPDATKELVNSLGGQDHLAAAFKAERPAYLYWLLNESETPEELRDNRYGMKAQQHPEIVAAGEETEPHFHLLDAMRKVYQGAADVETNVVEIFQELHDEGVPRGILPANVNTLGKYLSSITDMGTGEVKKKRTKKGIVYVLNFEGTIGTSYKQP